LTTKRKAINGAIALTRMNVSDTPLTTACCLELGLGLGLGLKLPYRRFNH